MSHNPQQYQKYFNAAKDLHGKRKHEDNMDVIRAQKRSLPICYGRRPLVTEIVNNENVILVSETGSGKTTQLPQYLLEAGLAKTGMIGCTQPRRVAAISVANRVAKEKNSQVGTLIGYTVRFEDVTSEQTKIKYMTDGMLLRESLLDPLLMKYSIIILDEAHERTIHTDVLFGVVKAAQARRTQTKKKDLKIVIMSATLQAEHFSSYFNNAKICFIEGRRHPIKIKYTEEVQTDYIHAALVTALQLHQEVPLGHDILVFLTGQEEIESLARLIKDCTMHLAENLSKVAVFPLFAALPHSEQIKAFRQTPEGFRKIILATNIAETSLTIPGVKYVVDTGMVKCKGYNPTTGFELLKVSPVSKAQARQRCGRAGRECPGVCYRLYTEDSFHSLEETTVPEIKRCNLKGVVLQLLALGVNDVLRFDFMDSPSQEALQDALRQLVLLKAVNSLNEQKLTDHGRLMAAFPLDPALARCLLSSIDLNCSEEMISIVALLSVESITYTPSDKREKARKSFQKFVSSEGDHITLLKFYRAYKQAKGNMDWCREHFVNLRAIKTVQRIQNQLREMFTRMNLKLSSCAGSKDFTPVRKALALGMFMNSAERQRDGSYTTISSKESVHIHPSSSLFRSQPSCVIYNESVQTSKRYIRNVCIVDPLWLIDACPEYFKNHISVPQAVSS